MESPATEELINSAKNAGVPKDQLVNFLSSSYAPLPWQLGFHAIARECDEPNGPDKVGVGGSRGPGKSHAVFSQVTLDDCRRVPNLKFLFIRHTGIAAKESFEDLIGKVLQGRIRYEYNRSANTLTFPNSSKVVLGGFQDERDVDKYIGIEYDGIAIEELNQLKQERVNKLLGSMRTSKPDWRPRLYASFNPGGVGHQDVRNLFVDPHREGTEFKTRFVPSTYRENPYLNVEYTEYLEGLTGNLGKAWRDGDFDIFEGQFFNEFSRTVHVIEPFAIPETWKKIRTIDHGRTAPTACLWGAVDHDGRVYWYREYYRAGEDADLNAQEIARMSEGETYWATVMDSACYSKTGYGETIADIYRNNGVYADPWPKNRLAGWALFHEYLRHTPVEKPKMLFFKTCHEVIREIPAAIHDDIRPEDLDCFVAGTGIKTINGEKPIEEIRSGDSVMTPLGFREAYITGPCVESATTLLELSSGGKIEGTSNHKVFIKGKGLVALEDVEPGDELLTENSSSLWLSNPWFTTALNIVATESGDIILRTGLYLLKALPACIARFLSTLLAPFLRATMFIIRTTISTIILLQTLPRLMAGNIASYTIVTDWKISRVAPQNGGRPRRENKHSRQTLKRCLKELLSGNFRAAIVARLLKQKDKINSVARTAIGKRITSRPPALCVALRHCEEKDNRPVRVSAVSPSGKKIVYRLRVKQAHLYYANGCLVTNTSGSDHALDAVRGALEYLAEKKSPKPLDPVGVMLQKMKQKDSIRPINLNKFYNRGR